MVTSKLFEVLDPSTQEHLSGGHAPNGAEKASVKAVGLNQDAWCNAVVDWDVVMASDRGCG